MKADFTRIAIVNRGEAAMRFINAARELSHENGCALCTIAFYTEPDRQAMFVRRPTSPATSAPLSSSTPGTARARAATPISSGSSGRSWTRARRRCGQAGASSRKTPRSSRCWSAWGSCSSAPPAATMRLLGDKIAAKRLAESIGVPVVPWSGGPVASTQDALAAGERLGYPLMIKASAGGGGRGIRSVVAPEALAEALTRARAEAAKAFGDPTLLLEKHLEGVRHVEVQIIADYYGTTWAVGVRDCTIQRRATRRCSRKHPSPVLTPEQDRALRDAAVRLANPPATRTRPRSSSYSIATPRVALHGGQRPPAGGAPGHRGHQVASTSSSCSCTSHWGVASRESPRQRGARHRGRLNAEDPDNYFAAAPGTIPLVRRLGPGLRIEYWRWPGGDSVPPEFDSMIAKLIAFGSSRNEALPRGSSGPWRIQRSSWARGQRTKRRFSSSCSTHRPEVARGLFGDNTWLNRVAAGDDQGSPRRPMRTWPSWRRPRWRSTTAEFAIESRRSFYPTAAARGRPQVPCRGGAATAALR